MPAPLRQILIAAAVLVGPDSRVLVVRKRGTHIFMQPGGKIEAGETAADALARELREELGLEIDTAAARYLGRFAAPAAHEPDAIAVAEAFQLPIVGQPSPQAEIEEIRWIDPRAPGTLDLAALSRDHILPAHCRAAVSPTGTPSSSPGC